MVSNLEVSFGRFDFLMCDGDAPSCDLGQSDCCPEENRWRWHVLDTHYVSTRSLRPRREFVIRRSKTSLKSWRRDS